MTKLKKFENSAIVKGKDVLEVAEELTKLAKGDKKPAYRGQHLYMKLFFDVAGIGKKGGREQQSIELKFTKEELKEILTTLLQLKAIPKVENLDVIDAEIVEDETKESADED